MRSPTRVKRAACQGDSECEAGLRRATLCAEAKQKNNRPRVIDEPAQRRRALALGQHVRQSFTTVGPCLSKRLEARFGWVMAAFSQNASLDTSPRASRRRR